MALKEKIDDSDISKDLIEDKLISLKLGKPIKKDLLKNKIYSIRLPEIHKIFLENHFNKKGISFSTGVRMILVQYINKLSKNI